MNANRGLALHAASIFHHLALNRNAFGAARVYESAALNMAQSWCLEIVQESLEAPFESSFEEEEHKTAIGVGGDKIFVRV
jgi:hypothetical protein